MATVLKMTKTRNGTDTGSNTLPIRTATLFVDQTGKVTIEQGGKNVQVVDMGFYGDHCVSDIVVKLWSGANISSTNYTPALVFYHETTKTKTTLNMSPSGSEYRFSIPSTITSLAGNYQIHFILKEVLDADILSNTSNIGNADDPAYREVFIAAACKAVVNNNSGYKYLTDFNWDTDVYNYELGKIRLKVKTPDNQATFTQSIALGGLKDGITTTNLIDNIDNVDASKVNIRSLKEGVEVSNASIVGNLLTITGTAPVNFNENETLEVIYPVNFTTSTELYQAPRKATIVVSSNAKGAAVGVSGNTSLGMKYDSYVTPIDVTSLINMPRSSSNTDKYTIFAKDTSLYVCPTDEYGLCWIPVGVTHTDGVWNVSFVGKNGSQIYYTNIIPLSVSSNVLSQEDIDSDNNFIPVADVDAQHLYDENNNAIHIIADENPSKVVYLNHNFDDIDSSIGWVVGIKHYSSEDLINAGNLANAINEKWSNEDFIKEVDKIKDLQPAAIEEIQGNITELENSITTITNNIGDWDKDTNDTISTKVLSIDNDLKELEDTVSNMESAKVTEQVEKNKNDIKSLNEIVNPLGWDQPETPMSDALINAISEIEDLGDAISSINDSNKGILANAKKYTDESIQNNNRDIDKNIEEATANLDTKLQRLIAQTSLDIQETVTNVEEELSGYISDNAESIRTNAESITAHNKRITTIEHITVPNLESKIEQKLPITDYQTGINTVQSSILKEIEDRAAADTLINYKIDGTDNANSLVKQIEAASKAAQDSETNSKEYTDNAIDDINTVLGEIDSSKGSVAKQLSDIEQLNKDQDDEIQSLKDTTAKLGTLNDVVGEGTLSEHLGDLTSLDDTVENMISASSSEISRLSGSVRDIVEGDEYIKNDLRGNGYVAKIVFLKTIEDYNNIANKDAHTLYLIQEETGD